MAMVALPLTPFIFPKLSVVPSARRLFWAQTARTVATYPNPTSITPYEAQKHPSHEPSTCESAVGLKKSRFQSAQRADSASRESFSRIGRESRIGKRRDTFACSRTH